MNPNVRKSPSADSGSVAEHAGSRALDDTAEPEGQFPHAGRPREVGPDEHEDAHEGATEEQVSDRTGPGAGYDETSEEQAASLPQGGQGMGQGRGANPGQQKDEGEAKVEEKRQDPPRQSER